MRLCKYCDTIYNLEKFIGIEVVDNSDDKLDTISILFRFEGDYLHSADEESTPYSFCVSISTHSLQIATRCEYKDIESAYENSIHDILRGLASEIVEIFGKKLEEMTTEDDYTIDIGDIKRDIMKTVAEVTRKENIK